MTEKTLTDLIHNKTAEQISHYYEQLGWIRLIFRESCRNYLSRTLMDNDEEHPFECDIVLEQEDAFGLSTLEMPHLTKMWQDPSEGYLHFEMEGYDDMDFDSLRDEELMQIINELEP